MYSPASLIARGSFISTGAVQTIVCQPGLAYFLIKNRSKWGATPAAATVVQAEWFTGLPAGSAYTTVTAGSSSDALEAGFLTSAGFTFIDPNNLPVFNTVALANPSFSQATNAVFTTSTDHGLSVGDIVTFSNLTGARQYGGIEFSVAAVGSGTTFTVVLNTTGITQATGGLVRRIAADLPFTPRRRVITKFSTAGGSSVIAMSSAHNFTVGQYVRLMMPSGFGLNGVNGQLVQITAIDTTPTVNTITVNFDATGMGTFAFPATGAVPFSFPEVIPVGELATTLSGRVKNSLYVGLQLGTGVVGVSTDIIDWWAFKSDLSITPGIQN